MLECVAGIALRRVLIRTKSEIKPIRYASAIFCFLKVLKSKLYELFRNKKTRSFNLVFFHLYSERDLNPHGHCCPLDFKSNVSTNSTIRATPKWCATRAKDGIWTPACRQAGATWSLSSFKKMKINHIIIWSLWAKDGIWTRDPHLGKVMLYPWATFASFSQWTRNYFKLQAFDSAKSPDIIR